MYMCMYVYTYIYIYIYYLSRKQLTGQVEQIVGRNAVAPSLRGWYVDLLSHYSTPPTEM